MNADPILSAVTQLREASGDGPAMRKTLDTLFRHVHTLKAKAAANGFKNLAAAAHDFENVLQSMRTGTASALLNDAIPADLWNSLKQDQKHSLQQSVSEGARIFYLETNFDVADFDREFQKLKETLTQTGEVISTSPRIGKEWPGKVNFRILYAQQGNDALPPTSAIAITEISPIIVTNTTNATPDLRAFDRAFEKFSAVLSGLQRLSDEDALEQAVRAGEAAALAIARDVEFELRGEKVALDERLADSLVHLVRNAVAHGIEASEERIALGKKPRGKIVIETADEDNRIKITVTDDGRGIDPATIQEIFSPGFSTASEISELSGRGVGLDAVRTAIEEAGGSISVSSQPGLGSSFEIILPVRPDPL